jgi:hypothetical protein
MPLPDPAFWMVTCRTGTTYVAKKKSESGPGGLVSFVHSRPPA